MQRNVQVFRALTLVLLAAAGLAAAQDTTTAPRPADYSVFTPGMSGRFQVWNTGDILGALAGISVSSYTNVDRANELRKLAAAESYDATARLETQLITALQAAGLDAVAEPLRRGAPGTPWSLSRGDLPARPRGARMLDVDIANIGLHAQSNFDPYRPAFLLMWRVIGAQGDLIVPSHRLEYDGLKIVATPDSGKTGSVATKPSRGSGATKAPRTPCDFTHFKAVEADPGHLFDCYDRAFRLAGDEIVKQLPKP